MLTQAQLEKSLLALSIHDYKVAELLTTMLTEDYFEDPVHKRVFIALKRLVDTHSYIDPFSVATSIQDFDGNLLKLTSFGFENLDGQAREKIALERIKMLKRVMLAKSLAKRLSELASSAVRSPNNLAEVIAEAENAIGEVLAKFELDEDQELPLLTQVKSLLNREKQGVVTGIPTLDNALLSAAPGDLFVVAGRTSVGKTAFAIQLAIKSALTGKRVVYVTLEMRQQEILSRFLAHSGMFPLGWFSSKRLSLIKPLALSIRLFNQLHIEIVDPSINPEAFDVPQLAMILQKFAPHIVIIDYLHLMASAKDDGMVEALSDLSRELKRLALRFGCIIVGLSQINRTAQASEADLEQIYYSSAIAHAASQVVMLRPMQIPPIPLPAFQEENSKIRPINLALTKNRNGPTVTVPALFIAPLMRFVELDQTTIPIGGGKNVKGK
jgi:replicative DNA helicase